MEIVLGSVEPIYLGATEMAFLALRQLQTGLTFTTESPMFV